MAVGGGVSYEGLLLVILNPDENGVNKLHGMHAGGAIVFEARGTPSGTAPIRYPPRVILAWMTLAALRATSTPDLQMRLCLSPLKHV